jgi:tagaturonate epimerase
LKQLEKYSFGVGDRFGRQAAAQLRAFQQLAANGIDAVPVWNKSNREHTLIGSEPHSVRDAAIRAVQELYWTKPWHVDADHIRLDTVDRFLDSSDFFTIDVADTIGKPASDSDVNGFLSRHPELIAAAASLAPSSPISIAHIRDTARKYLTAVQAAAKLYRHIAAHKSEDNFIAEVSMDETDEPQTPTQLLVILAALADEKVRLQTIAPKFTGRFNKGVDYVGDTRQFELELNDDLAVIAYAIKQYGLPENLKLSLHSGSDKFSIYPIIRRALQRTGAGLHVKTAGTSWLEELIGLAESGPEGLAIVKEIYVDALNHYEDLCRPYASVIDVRQDRLPNAVQVSQWSAEDFIAAIRHEPSHPKFNPSIRQLLHVSFKLAAKMGQRYLDALDAHKEIIGHNVTLNLYERHMRPLLVLNPTERSEIDCS